MRTFDPLAGKGYELWLLYPHPLVVHRPYYPMVAQNDEGVRCVISMRYTHIRHLYSPHADLQLLNQVCYGGADGINASS